MTFRSCRAVSAISPLTGPSRSWCSIKSPAARRADRSAGSLLLASDPRRSRSSSRPCPLDTLFQRNSDGDPTHHIVELKVSFRTEPMAVVTIDTGLWEGEVGKDGLKVLCA